MMADKILKRCADDLVDRAAVRDTPDGERSMAATVDAFWRIHGDNILRRGSMTESEGWQFMEILKMVRGEQGAFCADDHYDRTSYAVLGTEAALKENMEVQSQKPNEVPVIAVPQFSVVDPSVFEENQPKNYVHQRPGILR